MSVMVVPSDIDGRIKKIQQLYFRAKAWKRRISCWNCGTDFAFDATDMRPGADPANGLTPEFWAPYISCPRCRTQFHYVVKIRLWYRWIGRFFELKHQMDYNHIDWTPSEPPPSARIVEN